MTRRPAAPATGKRFWASQPPWSAVGPSAESVAVAGAEGVAPLGEAEGAAADVAGLGGASSVNFDSPVTGWPSPLDTL